MGYDNLFEPIDVGPVTFSNRIVRSAHGTLLTGERLIAYHEARAAGGVAMSTLEATGVHAGAPSAVPLYSDDCIPFYREISSRMAPLRHEAAPADLPPGVGDPTEEGGDPVVVEPDPEPDGRRHPDRDDHGHDRRDRRQLRLRRPALPRRRARRRRPARLERLPHRAVPVAGQQHPHRRVRRLAREPDAVPHGDPRGHPGRGRATTSASGSGSRTRSTSPVGSSPRTTPRSPGSSSPTSTTCRCTWARTGASTSCWRRWTSPLGQRDAASEVITRPVSTSPRSSSGRIMTLDHASHIVAERRRRHGVDGAGPDRRPRAGQQGPRGEEHLIRPCIGSNIGCVGQLMSTGVLSCVVNVAAAKETTVSFDPPGPGRGARRRCSSSAVARPGSKRPAPRRCGATRWSCTRPPAASVARWPSPPPRRTAPTSERSPSGWRARSSAWA